MQFRSGSTSATFHDLADVLLASLAGATTILILYPITLVAKVCKSPVKLFRRSRSRNIPSAYSMPWR
jgi:hypothetical protein